MVEVGQEAPDFELFDQDRQKVKLSDFRGRKHVLLVFYPAAFSPGCHSELCTLRDRPEGIVADDVEVLWVSTDNVWTLKAYKEQEGFPVRLLSDFYPHGEVARRYGVFNDQFGVAVRGTFLIDRDGIVRFKEVHEPLQLRDQDGWRRALEELRSAART